MIFFVMKRNTFRDRINTTERDAWETPNVIPPYCATSHWRDENQFCG